jgi:hypothetical protein
MDLKIMIMAGSVKPIFVSGEEQKGVIDAATLILKHHSSKGQMVGYSVCTDDEEQKKRIHMAISKTMNEYMGTGIRTSARDLARPLPSEPLVKI